MNAGTFSGGKTKATNMDGQDEQVKVTRTGRRRCKPIMLVARNRRPTGDKDSGGIPRSKSINMHRQDERDKSTRTGQKLQELTVHVAGILRRERRHVLRWESQNQKHG